MRNPPRLTPEQATAVEQNMGLVRMVVRRMRVPEGLVDDALQDGVFGLARAVQKYDAASGYAFSTYATAWVRQAVQRGRGDAEGVNYRRAFALNNAASFDEWVPVVSLDQVAHVAGLRSDEVVTNGDQLIDPDPLPEDIAAATSLLESVRDELGAEAFAELTTDNLAALARDRGVSRERMRQRRVALRARAREHLDDAA
jgi:RNA polymerase sigma factor (sigma-70 family)